MPRTGFPAEHLRDRAIMAALARIRLVGFDKVRLSDVARDVGVTHAALYAHFADKNALLDTVMERWLAQTDTAAMTAAQAPGHPEDRIEAWFVTLYQTKRQQALDDPQVYQGFDIASALDKPFVVAHLERLLHQLAGLVADAGAGRDPEGARHIANLLFRATAAFHHPTLIAQSATEDLEPQLRQIVKICLRGAEKA